MAKSNSLLDGRKKIPAPVKRCRDEALDSGEHWLDVATGDGDEEELFGARTSCSKLVPSTRVQPEQVIAALNSILSHLPLFWKRSEEYPIECLSEALCGLACLCSVRVRRPHPKYSAKYAQGYILALFISCYHPLLAGS